MLIRGDEARTCPATEPTGALGTRGVFQTGAHPRGLRNDRPEGTFLGKDCAAGLDGGGEEPVIPTNDWDSSCCCNSMSNCVVMYFAEILGKSFQ